MRTSRRDSAAEGTAWDVLAHGSGEALGEEPRHPRVDRGVGLGVLNVWHAVERRRRGAEQPVPELHHAHSLSLRPLAVGVVHGLAGSAAIALLVLTTIDSAARALLYLVVFGLGTTAGMACFTGAVVLPMAAASRRFTSLERYLGAVTGLASLALGAVLAVHLASELLS
jgi:hypothetical protein